MNRKSVLLLVLLVLFPVITFTQSNEIMEFTRDEYNKLVTNGDSHDHNGGDGGQIAYSSLSGTPTITPIDSGTAAGQMPFWNGSKWTNTETSELFWDDTLKNLMVVSGSGATEHGQKSGIIIENTSTWNLYSFILKTTTGKGNANFCFDVDGSAKGVMSWSRSGNYIGFANLGYNAFDFSLRINNDGSLTYNDGATGYEKFRVSADGKVRRTYTSGSVYWEDQVDSSGNAFSTITGTYYQWNKGFQFDGQAARAITVNRHTTAATAGVNGTFQAGGSTSGSTDKAGGTAIVSGGIATGTGGSAVDIYTATPGSTGTADNTPTKKLTIENDGDTYWTSSGGGLPYGSCYGNEIAWTQTNAAQNTWYAISDTDNSDGELNLVTHDGSGKLTVLKAGRYMVNWAATASVSVAGKHVQLGIGVTPNGGSLTAQDAGMNHFDLNLANSEIPIAGTAIIPIAASGSIELIIRTTDAGTPDLSVDHYNLVITQIGGN